MCLISIYLAEMANLLVDNISMFRPGVASRLPDDLDKLSRKEKAEAKVSLLFHPYEHMKKKKTKIVPLSSQPSYEEVLILIGTRLPI